MWTNADLEKLEKAIASGTLRVRFSDKEVTYQSISEMLKAREVMIRSLRPAPKSSRIVSAFDKGLG